MSFNICAESIVKVIGGMMTFGNVAAVFRKVKSGSADRLGALVAYVRMYAVSINGRAIKTGGYASMPDKNRREAKRANLYIPLSILPVSFPLRDCVSACQLFFAVHRNYVS